MKLDNVPLHYQVNRENKLFADVYFMIKISLRGRLAFLFLGMPTECLMVVEGTIPFHGNNTVH